MVASWKGKAQGKAPKRENSVPVDAIVPGIDIARSSLDEIEAIIDLAMGLDYLSSEDVAKVSAVRDECARTVFGLIRKLGVPVNS